MLVVVSCVYMSVQCMRADATEEREVGDSGFLAKAENAPAGGLSCASSRNSTGWSFDYHACCLTMFYSFSSFAHTLVANGKCTNSRRGMQSSE